MNLSWLALSLAIGILSLGGGCALFPTAVSRDARILPGEQSAVNATGTIGAAFNYAPPPNEDLRPAHNVFLGGLMVDASLRKGLGEGKERAIRLGAGTVGAYGGYERAYGSDQAGLANIVVFGGGLGGAHYTKDGAYPFVQPYLGTVMGLTDGIFRPELALRIGAQTGLVSYDKNPTVLYAYAFAFGTAEPRIRLAFDHLTVFGGLSVGYGVGRCQECFQTFRTANAVIVSPSFGVALNP